MKKYIKPELFYERFELTQQIAACDFDGHTNIEVANCSFIGTGPLGPTIILMDTAKGCETIDQSYCYHGSTGGFNVFNS